MTICFVIGLGAFVGGALRYLLQSLLGKPWGLWLSNVAATGLLFLAYAFLPESGAQASTWWFALLSVGLCGALSTWSSLAQYCFHRYQHQGVKAALRYYCGLLLPVLLFAACFQYVSAS